MKHSSLCLINYLKHNKYKSVNEAVVVNRVQVAIFSIKINIWPNSSFTQNPLVLIINVTTNPTFLVVFCC